MHGVSDSPNEDPELISTIQCLLLDTQYHWTEVLVVREVIPMFRAIEILLVSFLLDRGQLESLVLLPLLLDRSLLSGHIVVVRFLLNLGQLCVSCLSALTLVPDGVRSDLLSGALDPVARCRHQVVWELVAEFVCQESSLLF